MEAKKIETSPKDRLIFPSKSIVEITSFLISPSAFLGLFFLISLASAVFFTIRPSLSVVSAVYSFQPIEIVKTRQDETQIMAIRRRIQRHFSDEGVSVPLEDIVFVDRQQPASLTMFERSLQNVCGTDKNVYVWLPLKWELPWIGTRVYHWCWTPNVYVRPF